MATYKLEMVTINEKGELATFTGTEYLDGIATDWVCIRREQLQKFYADGNKFIGLRVNFRKQTIRVVKSSLKWLEIQWCQDGACYRSGDSIFVTKVAYRDATVHSPCGGDVMIVLRHSAKSTIARCITFRLDLNNLEELKSAIFGGNYTILTQKSRYVPKSNNELKEVGMWVVRPDNGQKSYSTVWNRVGNSLLNVEDNVVVTI